MLNKFDIIIPVYNGFEYLEPLFKSVFSGTFSSYRLIVIDDASPDEKVWPLLEKIKKENPEQEMLLLRNDENLGFVGTVNKAVTLVENHFIILNTDTEVPSGWLERLMYPILNLERVASVTPFTNSGQICSFPDFVKDNEIFMGLSVDELDKYFQMVKAEENYVEIPTGVGFCMAFNKKVVDEIGMFDEESFGKGYGEENDWSQRAIEAGHRNIMVPNLFVYHKHGGSFPSEMKKKLIEENMKKLLKKHPHYGRDVQKFIQADPLKEVRDFLIMVISANSEQENKPILFFDHEMGGGANMYREQFVSELIRDGKKALVFSYNLREGIFHLKFHGGEYEIRYEFEEIQDFLKLLDFIEVGEVIVSQLVSYPEPLVFLGEIIKIKEKANCKLKMLIHDYFSICPNVVLLDECQKYCGVPDRSRCQSCLAKCESEYEIFTGKEARNIEKWRESWGEFLKKADEVVCFSNSSKEIILRAYPDIEQMKIKIIPHQVDYIRPLKFEKKTGKEFLTIGIMGGINRIKGADVVGEMLKIIDKENLKMKIVVIGPLIGKIKSKNLLVHGNYKKQDIEMLVEKYDIDVFLIPSIVPETFSFTTEEAMKMGLPVAVFNLGAQAERVGKYAKGHIIPEMNAKSALATLESIKEH